MASPASARSRARSISSTSPTPRPSIASALRPFDDGGQVVVSRLLRGPRQGLLLAQVGQHEQQIQIVAAGARQARGGADGLDRREEVVDLVGEADGLEEGRPVVVSGV